MSNYTDKIKKLRHSTGAGFKDCSSAINESRGDIDKAIEILRIKGISKASKKMSRDAKEGLVAISGDKNKISTIEVNCETDFVAKNDEFINFAKELSELNLNNNANVEKLKNAVMKNDKTVEENLINFISKIGEKITIGRTKIFNSHGTKNYSYSHTIVKDNLSKLAVIVSLETSNSSNDLDEFGKKLAMHIAASNPLVIDSNSINKEILNKEEKLISEELKNTGKPDEIIKKIGIGKINKFKEENSLLTQFWVMDPKKKVKDIINQLKISDLKIKNFYRIKIGE
jgi:elongation factor Ts|tara:strand:- start:19 stop:873 length:855 start_codon:yes stop_codon:yes gene_type:complete